MEIIKNFHQKVLFNHSQLPINKYGQNLMFPHSSECATRRDYIFHRLGAISQQISILKQVQRANIESYNEKSRDTGDKLDLTFNAINQLSYCFDNLIFNLASLSDYFGNYLGLYIYGPKSQTLKWNGFVNKTNKNYKDSEFGSLVASEHREWFSKLHEYRGDIIHKKAILVEVKGFENKRFMPHTVDRLEFEISDSLKRYFHIFRNEESRELIHCVEKICHRTLNGLCRILDASEELTFDESHKRFRSQK